MICGMRLTLETVGSLLDKILASPGGADSFSEREFAGVALENLHPISLRAAVSSDQFMATWPSHVYWVSPKRDWALAHCFHLHPLAVRGVPARIDVNTTIDGNYLDELGVAPQQLFVVGDSENLIAIEVSPREKTIEAPEGRFTIGSLVRFAARCSYLHREFFAKPIFWRAPGIDKLPQDILDEAASCIAAVKKGSVYEDIRFRLISFIQNVPVLLFIARLIVRSGRKAKRIASSLFSGEQSA